jgi:Ran GTPase-activating protein (RanGAP) involved in mRNA processing and transport
MFSFSDMFIYQNSQLEMNISKCQSRTTVDLSKQQLLDRDMETVVKQALIEKECIRLDLGYNVITSKGAAVLADALKHNTTLEELDFHNNRVSDTGVHSLAEVLSSNTSIVKALGLGSNGITDKGAEHLAEMLKTNRTITWLALAGNQIGDRGVQLLANTLAHQNTSLLVLSLHVNKSISDVSVTAITNMLQHNKSLKKLWMQDCNISDEGKTKLREAAKIKQGFSLYM